MKNSCHFGAAGYYSNLAAKEGLIGISMSNADPVIAVPNSRVKNIGSKPRHRFRTGKSHSAMTTEANKSPASASLQPMAAHKGYGFAVLVELFSAVIPGTGMLRSSF